MTDSSQQPCILVTGSDLAPEAMTILDGYKVIFAGGQPNEGQLIALCEQYNPMAIIVRYGKITARVIDAAPRLRVISKHGSGIDVIDQIAAKERRISVCSAPGANAAAVAEHSWAMILASAKSIVSLDCRLKQGHWDKSTHKSVELEGRTLGLIGLGAIGSRVATIGNAFGMQVIAHDPWAKTFPPNCEPVSFDDVFRRADVISLHCPLTEQNRQMVNQDTLSLCKPGAILVNTARGGLIDDAALIEALKHGPLGYAALDSFHIEPLTAPHPWQHIDNVIISPHIGGVSDASYIKMGTVAAQNVIDILQEAVTEQDGAA